MDFKTHDLAAAEAEREFPDNEISTAHENGVDGFMLGVSWLAALIDDEILADLPADAEDWENDACFSVAYALAELLGHPTEEN